MCALVEGEPVGMAASSFTAVSLKPPLVSVCVRSGSATWRRPGRHTFTVVVQAESGPARIRCVALQPGRAR